MSAFNGIWVMLGLAFAGGICATIGYSILGPITRAAKDAKRPTQFRMTDFVWLMIQLQLALAIVVGYIPQTEVYAYWMFIIFLGFALITMWAGAMRELSRAGVLTPLRRATFVLFLLPVSLTIMVVSSIAIVGAPIAFITTIASGMRNPPSPSISAGIFVLALVATPLVCLGLRKISYWILSDAVSTQELTTA